MILKLLTRIEFRLSIIVLILILFVGCKSNEAQISNNLTYAVAWKTTAAEYRALYYQGFNVARSKVREAIGSSGGERSKPLAIIADVDDTLVLSGPYWGNLIENNVEFFDDSVWDEWVGSNLVSASPGAIDFLRYCEDNGVEVFYVTNRDQGDDTRQYLLNSLKRLDFPYVDDQHLFVLQDSSNKELIQEELRNDFDVIVMLGDNLNDFSRKYYVSNIDERYSLTEQDSQKYGAEFILFPNPTDGHWLRAIFGESEPADSTLNKMKFRGAASASAWKKE